MAFVIHDDLKIIEHIVSDHAVDTEEKIHWIPIGDYRYRKILPGDRSKGNFVLRE